MTTFCHQNPTPQFLNRCLALLVGVFAFSVFGQVGVAEEAKSESNERAAVTLIAQPKEGSWQVWETDNFRIRLSAHDRAVQPSPQELADLLESARSRVSSRWQLPAQTSAWAMKCQVTFYPTVDSYCQMTGYPAESKGVANVEIGGGTVWRRQLDISPMQQAVRDAVLTHELTHILLADRFCWSQIPRWADEGIAIASEPSIDAETSHPDQARLGAKLVGRRHEQQEVLRDNLRRGTYMPMRELLIVRQYPRERDRQQTLYAESGSLIDYLLAKDVEPHQILDFVESTQKAGVEQAVAAHLPFDSTHELEQSWVAWVDEELAKADAANATPVARK